MNSSFHTGFRDYAEAGHIKLEDSANAPMLVASTLDRLTTRVFLHLSYIGRFLSSDKPPCTSHGQRRIYGNAISSPSLFGVGPTLNPGTIVYKCGYEWIHLGPLHFNALCAGNKVRKKREPNSMILVLPLLPRSRARVAGMTLYLSTWPDNLLPFAHCSANACVTLLIRFPLHPLFSNALNVPQSDLSAEDYLIYQACATPCKRFVFAAGSAL